MRRLTRVSALLVALALCGGCAAGQAFRNGEERARVGDWDSAVVYYREAMQADPERTEYRIALERATLSASHVHFDLARDLEAKDQLDAALVEYRKVVEFDPANRQAQEKAAQLERTIRDRIEASRPKPAIVQLREQARQAAAAPLLNPASRTPLDYRFTNASLRDILTFIGNATGISVIFDASFQQDRSVTVTLNGTIEQVLNTLLSSNGLFYSVLDEKTIVVATDTGPNRLKFERQVAQTFPLSYADATELTAMLTAITRTTTGVTIPPVIIPIKTNNSITVRATEPVMAVIRELVATNDKPRAEITLDVEILEVSRGRVKDLGLQLSNYQIGAIFSPEVAPSATTPPFNLNTITQGVSNADFYLSVPQAVFRFLASDTHTKILAQTQLRGAEGGQLQLNIGAREPYLSTTFAAIATGGPNVNPVSSYTFEQVGVTVMATPRVTAEGDIILTPLQLKSAALGPNRVVGGSPAPSFTNREVTTSVRLRDGESHLLAGLLQDVSQETFSGVPGIINIPGLRHILSHNDTTSQQTDIVMLLTPRIIRTHELSARDLSPIFVGTNQNFGLTGPPPLIAAPPDAGAAPDAAPGVPAPAVPGPAAPAPGPGTTTPPQGGQTPPLAEPQPPSATAAPPTTTLAPAAQITLTAPTGEVRVAAGPYTVPIFLNGGSRVSTVSITVTYNPAVLRMRTIQEGTFLRQGGVSVVFTPKTDAATGRVDLAFVRTGDALGASGSGLLAAIQFDAVGAGNSPLTVNGVATNPGGGTIPIQFSPASVVVR